MPRLDPTLKLHTVNENATKSVYFAMGFFANSAKDRGTGQGGQDAPGGKQAADQKFTKGNLGLRLSSDTVLIVGSSSKCGISPSPIAISHGKGTISFSEFGALLK